jgi:type II secretory pathway pseudopilin PulG
MKTQEQKNTPAPKSFRFGTGQARTKKQKVNCQLSIVNCSGFTLIETLIYIAIVATAVSSFVLFSISVSNSRNKTYVVQEVQANVRVALNIMSQKIRAAQSVATTTSTYDTDPGFLILNMASTTLNPTHIGLNQNDGILGIKEGNAATTSITSDEVLVTNLVFTNLTGSSTQENTRIQMTIEYNNPSGDDDFNYLQSVQTAVGVRQ